MPIRLVHFAAFTAKKVNNTTLTCLTMNVPQMYSLCFYLNNVLNVPLQTQSCVNYLQTAALHRHTKER